ncbi:hypothetical protein [Alkalibacterium sp. MB6]|uniref:hypothetical protein n=1 Tax=Alkalibacterium sp. MB6 TaxID=2081965 RepID=UPI00137B5E81|nr:hypothetical protein [Alkalibacterium sp. MB6]
MAKFKTPIKFRGVKEKKVFNKDEEFEMTIKRAEEVQSNIKKNYGVEVEFERLDAPEDDKDKKDNKKEEEAK